MSTPAINNPDNLTPEQYGAADGWRLHRIGEMIAPDGEYYYEGSWNASVCKGDIIEFDDLAYRTRTPDSFAAKPATVSPRWIPMSERNPTEGQRVLAWDAEVKNSVLVTAGTCWAERITHWQPWVETPPPRELTQADKDAAAFSAWDRSPDGHSLCGGSQAHRRDAFLAGITYERAEIAKMIGRTPIEFAIGAHNIAKRVRGGAT
jgi:hypothetical protein